MSRRATFLGLAFLLLAAPSAAEWRNRLTQSYVADESGSHPRKRSLVMRLPVDAPNGGEICWSYANWRVDRPDQGSLKVRLRITRQASPTGPIARIDRVNFGKVAVSDNNAFDCAPIGPWVEGDVARFSFRFIGLPRLRVNPRNELEARIQFSGSLRSPE